MKISSSLRTFIGRYQHLIKPRDTEVFYEEHIDKLIEDKRKLRSVHIPIYFRNLKNASYLLYFPLVFTTGSIALDLMVTGGFAPYKVAAAINNVFLINCYNTGIVYGFKDYFIESASNEKLMLQVGLTGLTLFLSHVLTTTVMPITAFYPIYIFYFFTSKYLTNEVDKVYIGYRLQFNLILLICMTVLLVCVTLRYKEYKNKLQDAKKVNQAVQSHMLCTDAQFKEQMNSLEQYVDELAIKLPKEKNNIKH